MADDKLIDVLILRTGTVSECPEVVCDRVCDGAVISAGVVLDKRRLSDSKVFAGRAELPQGYDPRC